MDRLQEYIVHHNNKGNNKLFNNTTTMADRKNLGLKSNTKKKGNASSSSSNGCTSNNALVALIVAAFLFSAATMFIVSPKVARSIAVLDNMGMGIDVPEENLRKNKKKGSAAAPATTETEIIETPAMAPLPPGAPRSSISDLVTWMLSSNDKDAKTQHAALSTLNDSPRTPLEFAPGSLSLSHASTLSHCYADPSVYGRHFNSDGSRVRVSYADEHKLIYVMLPKSGSSTARYMLENHFNAKEVNKSLKPKDYRKGRSMEGVEVISFVRDPLSRFFSQYDEAFVRTAPWVTQTPHPFPYIFENLHSYHDYEDVFCPPSTRNSRKDCLYRKSKENGTLVERLERFVQDYDGRSPFDIHLKLQVPILSSTDGEPLHITQLYNTTDSEGGWKRIAKQFLGEDAEHFGNQKQGEGVIAGRSYPRRFNSSMVSVDTQRRICELTLLDYCCLNLPLPEVCVGQHYSNNGDDEESLRELFCVLDGEGHIQPGIFPGNRRRPPVAN